jgi:hypothetical protein
MGIRSLASKNKIVFADFDLFIKCCELRYQYDEHEATPEQWQELAARFQEAKGARYSWLAEYCLRKARIV